MGNIRCIPALLGWSSRVPTVVAATLLAVPGQAQWTTDHLSVPRFDLAAAAADGKAFFAGGYDDKILVTDLVEVFDARTGIWTTATLSVARARLAAAAAGGKVFFAGGHLADLTATDRVDVYDIATDTWSLETLPVPAELLAGASVGDLVFFAGGMNITAILSIVQIYDVLAGTWSIVDLQAGPRLRIATAQDGERVYFAGGGGTEAAHKALNIYDSTTNTWSKDTIPHVHVSGGVAVVDGKLLVAGGCVVSKRLVDVYEIASGTWKTQGLPTPRCRLVSGSAGPFAVFASGFGDMLQDEATADVLNAITGEWTTGPISTHARDRGVAILSEHNTIMFAGGRTDPANTDPTDLIDVFSYSDPLGTPYCGPANLNSTGQSAEVSALGAQAAADSFVTLSASKMPPGVFGYFLAGSAKDFVPFAGGSQGNLCLGGDLGRYARQVRSTGPDGSFSMSVDLRSIPTWPPHDVAPGETWQFQAWYRDQNPGPTANFTDGVSIPFL